MDISINTKIVHKLFVVEINVIVSALAGAGSFFSPCILPILPAFISYLSGTTLHEVQNSNNNNTITTTTTGGSVAAAAAAAAAKQSLTVKRSTRLNIFLNTVYFVLGFSLVFAVLGVILNSVL